MSSRTQRFLPAKIQRSHDNPRTKPEQFENVIREAFDFARKVSRKGVLDNETNEFIRKSYESYIEKRRKAVLRTTLADTLNRYQTIMDPEDAVIAWIELNAPIVTYTHMEKQHHVLFAAAIWMLDRITSQEDWQKKLFKLLPRNDWETDEFYEPNVWDCSYDYDLISSVVNVLYYRNLNVSIQNKKNKIDSAAVEDFDDRLQLYDDHPYVLTSEYAAAHQLPENWRFVHEDDHHRECFRALLALIPQEAIDSVKDEFRTLLRQWVDRYFDGIAVFAKNRKALDQKKSQIAEEHNRIIDELEILMDSVERKRQVKTIRKKDNTKSKERPQTNPLLMNPLIAAPAKSVNPLLSNGMGSMIPGIEDFLRSQFANQPITVNGMSRSGFKLFGEGKEDIRDSDQEINAQIDQIERLYHQIENLGDRFDELQEQTQEFYSRERTYSIYMSECGRIPNTSDEDFSGIPPSLSEPMRLSDAYGLCFALLYLIETGDNLPWLYGACYGFMMEVCESLPWGLEEYDEIEDPIWNNDHDETDVPKAATVPDWNERKYTYKDSSCYYPKSLAQILYEKTGCILPRDCTIYYPEYETFRQYGIKGKDASIMMLMSAALSTARRNVHANNLDPEYFRLMNLDPQEDDTNHKEGEAGTEPNENHKLETDVERPKDEKDQLIDQLRKELKRSKESLHSAETESRNARKELTAARSVYEREHRELADLREIVFNAQFADATPDQQSQSHESPEYDYPYETKKRTTVFGGHDTFLKAIKPMLPNVRFIDANYMTFSPELVRNADIVWVQTNCISHPMFWNVVKYTKQYGVQLRYFTQASAERCADQIVEADKGQ